MEFLLILLLALAVITAAVLIISYFCFRQAFYVPKRDPQSLGVVEMPEGEVYEPFKERIEHWAKETKSMPHREFCITSFDGLKLYAKYYECRKGAPIELMFHGYRGNAQRDLAGGVQRCFKLGRNAFIVDQRCSEKSEGKVITFGINEHRDCKGWIDFVITHFGNDVKIILAGISMGAATVLMAAGNPLPKNVVGVLADCGYNSAKDIIKKVIKDMGLPSSLGYRFVKLGARIYGHFDLEETCPETALKSCRLPVIFFHGEADDYVPCYMSKINYDACQSRKMLVTVAGAGHGLSYPVAPEKYLSALKEFFAEEAPCNE